MLRDILLLQLLRPLVLCAGVILLVACEEQVGANTASNPPPPSVDVAVPLVKPVVEWDEYTGQFEAEQAVEIRARVSGYLESIHFKDG